MKLLFLLLPSFLITSISAAIYDLQKDTFKEGKYISAGFWEKSSNAYFEDKETDIQYQEGYSNAFSLIWGNRFVRDKNETIDLAFFYEAELNLIRTGKSMYHHSQTRSQLLGLNGGMSYPLIFANISVLLGIKGVHIDYGDRKWEVLPNAAVELSTYQFEIGDFYVRGTGGQLVKSKAGLLFWNFGFRYFY